MSTTAKLADELLDVIAQEDPLNEFIQGLPGYDHLLSDHDEAAEARLRDRAADIAAAAGELDPAEPDWATQAVVTQQAAAVVDRIDARLVEHTMADYLVSPIARLLTMVPLARPITVEQERSYLTRLATIPDYLAKVTARHRSGVAAGRLPVGERARYAITRLDGYLADAAGDPLRQPLLSGSRVAERDRLIEDVVRPAFAAYRQALDTDIAPHGRSPERAGLCWLPDGDASYAALARMHTTTDRTPEQLHQIGLDLIEQLAEEYVAIGSRVFGVRTVAEVHHRLRTDTALRWGSAQELVAAARSAVERAEKAAPQWFGLMPSHGCVVEPTPEADAPNAAAAWYSPAALDGSRPGTYLVNTYRATERDRYVSEALTFHEAVPGHHFQITVAQELAELPQLRRLVLINSYSEGWGLYAERLAEEMGLYSDDIARLGMLAMDSTRAARLVVDTGVHAFGWSRRRVVEYLRTNTVMAEVEIQSETDRYIEMPGQALSYMIGRLEIQRLRARAERELGAAFDVRAFHDLVLGGGALPMAVLDDAVAAWTANVAAH
ncbi:DUF885 family protein [Streptomyces sp. NL15-2K]|uniref:DUF885 domain-containing protein n=1 Tax=Streptomyces sp. NL15-2K TaxID=376149 RepID=UPI000F57C828|nr:MULTISPECIES: DUF885 domain-containing protein [Actinomycetes]WKX06050.1 DUF885 domain-containing protein [Kutzneria buriramensis]GCB52700.1 hypothetical protein SNL152K_10057 [Streptomyces sp. NL15-2K]